MIRKLQRLRRVKPPVRNRLSKPAPNGRRFLPAAQSQPRRVSNLTQEELAEVREALQEYELTKGDWSKSR
jgi:hypothetical protein